MHECLGGGLMVENLNIRILLYADDIVILADEISTLQKMIGNLEVYCSTWNLEVNLNKSEIVVFRNGGKLRNDEKWFFNGAEVKIASEYNYLGVLFTPKLKFSKHVEARNTQAKQALNSTWKNFMAKRNINLEMKWKVYLAVCRAIQSYAAHVWGFSLYDEVDKLQRYFMKRILKLPSFTPTYVLMLETAAEENHFYTLALNLKYISRTLFMYSANRLPYQLSLVLLRQNIFWVKELKSRAASCNLQWPEANFSQLQWNVFSMELLKRLKTVNLNENIRKKNESSTRIYKHLDYQRGIKYICSTYDIDTISWILKARAGLIELNYNRFDARDAQLNCTLCNMQEWETMQHYLGICPALNEFRMMSFRKVRLSMEEVINILNGQEAEDWPKLVRYLKVSLNYRKFLINEFN